MRKILYGLLLLAASGCVSARSDLVNPTTSRYRVITKGPTGSEDAQIKAFYKEAKRICPSGFRTSKLKFIGQGESVGYVVCNENLFNEGPL
ncbi:hypothetical protein [Vulgatibacter incomptus]|uniref:hypothetical protein n=1 Tax=Vulgatibacter incomptus TaxID=1391653 RepID=UPI000681ED24|nr:hypothetical protein [Vulgatibacter incomptus]